MYPVPGVPIVGIGAKKITTRANDEDEEREKREETGKKRHLPFPVSSRLLFAGRIAIFFALVTTF